MLENFAVAWFICFKMIMMEKRQKREKREGERRNNIMENFYAVALKLNSALIYRAAS